jgi:hypothetical protein
MERTRTLCPSANATKELYNTSFDYARPVNNDYRGKYAKNICASSITSCPLEQATIPQKRPSIGKEVMFWYNFLQFSVTVKSF